MRDFKATARMLLWCFGFATIAGPILVEIAMRSRGIEPLALSFEGVALWFFWWSVVLVTMAFWVAYALLFNRVVERLFFPPDPYTAKSTPSES